MKHSRCVFEPLRDIRRSGSPKRGGQVCSQAPWKGLASWRLIGPTPGRGWSSVAQRGDLARSNFFQLSLRSTGDCSMR